ncbi:Transcription factor [Trichinella spiralis]|uniref:Transcription factor n=1 Tax=Trichinella spiralis TaxID=6334 RepID=A0ABR3KFW2_TRISP
MTNSDINAAKLATIFSLYRISKETIKVVVFHWRSPDHRVNDGKLTISHLCYTFHVSSQSQTRVKLNRIPCVRASSKLAVECRPKRSVHENGQPRSSGSARAGLSASSASDSNTLDQPNNRWQSQSLFRSYGSVLPTSLTYIILSARGYSPWRPAADISTTKYEIYQASLGFSRTDESAPNTVKKSAFYGYQNPYLRTTRFQGMRPLKRKENSFRNSRRSFSEFACVTARLS